MIVNVNQLSTPTYGFELPEQEDKLVKSCQTRYKFTINYCHFI